MIFIDKEVFLAEGVGIHARREDVLVEAKVVILTEDGGLEGALEGGGYLRVIVDGCLGRRGT